MPWARVSFGLAPITWRTADPATGQMWHFRQRWLSVNEAQTPMEPTRRLDESQVGNLTTVELELSGLHCQSCVALIEETLRAHPGVELATVNLETSRASVTYDPTVASPGGLCSAVTEIGYTAVVGSEAGGVAT